jgi:hypothetical protein
MAVRVTVGQPSRLRRAPWRPRHLCGHASGSLACLGRLLRDRQPHLAQPLAGSSRTECREALALPADPHRVVILRRIEAVDGPARGNVVLDVRAGSGRSRMTGLSRAGGRWSGRSGAIRFRWSGAAKARPGADGLALTVTLPAGVITTWSWNCLTARWTPGLPTRARRGRPPRNPGPLWCPTAAGSARPNAGSRMTGSCCGRPPVRSVHIRHPRSSRSCDPPLAGLWFALPLARRRSRFPAMNCGKPDCPAR